MTDTVTITIDYKAADFVHATRWALWRTVIPYLLCGVMALGGGVLIFVMFWQFGPVFGWGSVAGVVIGSALGIPRGIHHLSQQAVKNFESNQAMQHPVTWIITSREIQVRGKGLEAKLELNNFVRVAETAQGFLFWMSTQSFNYLPKHALASREQLETVRRIVQLGLPGTAQIQLRDD